MVTFAAWRLRQSSIAASAATACAALGAGGVIAQDALDVGQPTIAVTGIGRVVVEPNQAIVSLGATVQRQEARDAMRELEGIIRDAVSAIRNIGIAPENLQTASLSLMPVYAERGELEPNDPAASGRREPRIVAYRASNLVQITIEDLTLVGTAIDSGIGAGVNEVRNIAFGLGHELPYQATAIERAVDAARTKARTAASALGVRVGQPIEIVERSAMAPRRQVDIAYARSETPMPIEPGDITIEAVVDVTFRLEGGTASAARD